MPANTDYSRSAWGTTFRDKDVERQFRKAALGVDVRQAVRNTLILSVIYSSLLINDIPDYLGDPLLPSVLLGRLGVTGSGFVFAWLVHRFRSPPLIDWGFLLFAILLPVSIVFLLEVAAIHEQRQPHMLTALMAFVMITMCVWILAPNRFILQVVESLLVAAIFAAFVWRTSPEYNVSIVFSALLFIVANFVGATISHRLHELRRTEWAALEAETRTSERLETEIGRRRILETRLEELVGPL